MSSVVHFTAVKLDSKGSYFIAAIALKHVPPKKSSLASNCRVELFALFYSKPFEWLLSLAAAALT